MGQQNSRKSGECTCGCGAWERRRFPDEAPGSVQRYVNAVTDRWSRGECSCRSRARRRAACVCTAYRRADTDTDTLGHGHGHGHANADAVDTRLAAVLRREIDAIVINAADGDTVRENGEPTAEVYVLSVAPRPALDGEDTSDGSRELTQSTDGSIRLHPHFQVVCGGELRALLLRGPVGSVGPVQMHSPPAKVHTQVDYIHCLVPDLQEITACSFYWGKMDRYEAERLLDNKPEGTFLLRDSAQEEHLFSVSFRKYGRSLHARIEHYQHRFSFDSHDPAVFAADTVTGLIEHYKDPACVMFFEPMLTMPLPRAEPFSLQQLARAVIVSHTTYDGVEKLPLPARLRSYLKEYHYRQRVRVRRLEPDMYDTQHC